MLATLAGGVGAARFLAGLVRVVPPADVVAIVNTADDDEFHGLYVSPDLDSVTYTLAGASNVTQGWGLEGETFATLDALGRYDVPTWFRLGDKDLATHLFRAERLHAGLRLTETALELQHALGARSRILPMTDDPVRTRVRTDDGWLDFQDYFVRLHQAPEVREVRYDGAAASSATPEVRDAIATANVVVVAPSNPVVSIGPILAVPGVMDEITAVRRRGVRVVGVSGIVGGKAVRGPADRMLSSLGEESSALGVARRYAAAGLLDTLVIDAADEALAGEIRSLGLGVAVTDTIMTDVAARARLAREMLALVTSGGVVA